MDRTVDTAAFILARTGALDNLMKCFVVGVDASGPNQGQFIINDSGTSPGGASLRRMTITNAGEAIFGGKLTASQFFTPSSLRFKTNLRPLEKPTSKLAQLNGVRFDWKSNGHPSLGLIAEEVRHVFPELVLNNKGFAQAVNYDGLLAVLIEAARTHERQLRILREKREALSHLLKQLKAQGR